jgi:histidyl-tRNA synthetase
VEIKINHRGLFNTFLAKIGASDKSAEILHTVDKLAKAGLEETLKNLELITDRGRASAILAYIGAADAEAGPARYTQTLDRITDLAGAPPEMSERMRLLGRFMDDTGTADSFTLDPSITRGLDYYTGVVFETFLSDLPEIGSICSGGRYDNLCGLYTKKAVSGVGASIGLDRMIAAMESLDKIPRNAGFASLAVACTGQEHSGACQALAAKLREHNISCTVFVDGNRETLVKQFVAAEKCGIRRLIIPGQNPLSDPLTVRDIAERKNREGLSLEELLEWARSGF